MVALLTGNVQPQFEAEIVVMVFMIVSLALFFWMLRIAGSL